MRPVTLDLSQVKDQAVKAALTEIQRASIDTLQNDTSSSGAAMSTLIGAAADEIAYFTSPTTTAFAALTAFIRTLLGAADAATARSTLGAGTGNGSVTSVATAGLATGGPITATGTVTVSAVTKSQQQTGTDNADAVTPLHQQDHDSAAKVWVSFTGSSGVIQGASYNVASVTRNGAGDYTVNFTTNFTDTNYACLATAEQTAGGQGFMNNVKNAGRAVSSVRVLHANSVFALVDPTSMFVVCYGRQ